MNKKQMIVMWCGIALIVLTGLFPLVQKPARRLEIGFLFEDYEYLEFTVTLIIWILVALVTIGLIITFRDNSKGKQI
ncbi:MAG: hypothetical protein JSV61_09565 [Anaerolineales bacterium]|nr:MAG: hypothetical protein JSV61_09565 [Anaerolineales bacterium]